MAVSRLAQARRKEKPRGGRPRRRRARSADRHVERVEAADGVVRHLPVEPLEHVPAARPGVGAEHEPVEEVAEAGLRAVPPREGLELRAEGPLGRQAGDERRDAHRHRERVAGHGVEEAAAVAGGEGRVERPRQRARPGQGQDALLLARDREGGEPGRLRVREGAGADGVAVEPGARPRSRCPRRARGRGRGAARRRSGSRPPAGPSRPSRPAGPGPPAARAAAPRRRTSGSPRLLRPACAGPRASTTSVALERAAVVEPHRARPDGHGRSP